VQFEACGVKFPCKPVTIPAGMMTLFPVNLPVGDAMLTYATAQPVAQRDGKMWFEKKEGIPAEFCWNGKVQTVKSTSLEKPFATLGGVSLYLLSTEQAGLLFLDKVETDADRVLTTLTCHKIQEAGALRTITMGIAGAAEEPVDADFDAAAVYRISLPADATARQSLMQIRYRGDVARLYANGKLIDDNFYNGRPFLMGLWRLPAEVTELELRILPLQKDMPVYFPREADKTPGEEVLSIQITPKPL
jgi:hypothetical protein